MREAEVDLYLVKMIKAILPGAVTRRLRWVGRVGAPDRILIHRGWIVFVETKATTGRLTPPQIAEHARMRAAGAWVVVVDGEEGVDALIASVAKRES